MRAVDVNVTSVMQVQPELVAVPPGSRRAIPGGGRRTSMENQSGTAPEERSHVR